MLLQILGISDAFAATAPATGSAEPGFLSMLPMLIIFIAVFYFLLIRPQSKRAKQQQQLLESLTVGDEIVTNGGVAGRIVKLRDDFVVLNIAKDVEITLQKAAIATILPKGTLDTIQ
jgi:preprotein translocase subunit YajC